MKILKTKKYTYLGQPFTLLTLANPGKYPVVGHDSRGAIWLFSLEGVAGNGSKLFPASPFDSYKIDEPVMVRQQDTDPWKCRFFAGFYIEETVARVWNNGATSWSVGTDLASSTWAQCRRPTAEELNQTFSLLRK